MRKEKVQCGELQMADDIGVMFTTACCSEHDADIISDPHHCTRKHLTYVERGAHPVKDTENTAENEDIVRLSPTPKAAITLGDCQRKFPSLSSAVFSNRNVHNL